MALSDKIMRQVTAKGTTKSIYGMNDITYARQGKALFIGDSYLQGYTPTGTISNWGDYLAENLGIGSSDYKCYSQGGCGFAAVSNNKTFGTLAQEAADAITDKDDYTIVVVAGGYNDSTSVTYYDVRSGMISTYNTIHTNFPNALIVYAYIGWGYRKSTSSSSSANAWSNFYRYRNWSQAWAAIHRDSNNTNSSGIDAIMILDAYIALGHAMGGYMTTDGVHPTANGQQCIADYIYSKLVGFSGGLVPYADATNNQWYNQHLEIMTYGEWVHMNWFATQWSNTSADNGIEFTDLTGGSNIAQGTVYGRINFTNASDSTKLYCGNGNSTSTNPLQNAYVTIPVNAYIYMNSTYYQVPSRISFDNDGTLLIAATVGVSTGTAWASGSITQCLIGSGQATIPLFYL